MACIACAKARRRCGNQKPHCLRCRTRGISCQYPPKKPSSFVALVDDALDRTDNEPMIFGSFPSLLSLSFGGNLQESWWFASPETWSIDTAPESLTTSRGRFTNVELERLLYKVVQWFAGWVETGQNVFIHERLYHHRFPRCIQDAYISLSAYLYKTASNEHMIFRIIEDRVTQLVTKGLPSQDSSREGSFDALEHLGHVQALLVYQCISLFDGNIRLRHLAERHIPVLESWVTDLSQQVSRNPDCGESLFRPPQSHSLQRGPAATHFPAENLAWYNYIFIESLRRTWLITAGVQGIFKLIQSGKSSCMGGVIFTARSGFWEAKSAMAWEKRCCEEYAGLVRLTEVDKLFAMVPREDICDFAKVVLQCTYGQEQLERWGVGVECGEGTERACIT